jgi:hypothetical protein
MLDTYDIKKEEQGSILSSIKLLSHNYFIYCQNGTKQKDVSHNCPLSNPFETLSRQ